MFHFLEDFRNSCRQSKSCKYFLLKSLSKLIYVKTHSLVLFFCEIWMRSPGDREETHLLHVIGEMQKFALCKKIVMSYQVGL